MEHYYKVYGFRANFPMKLENQAIVPEEVAQEIVQIAQDDIKSGRMLVYGMEAGKEPSLDKICGKVTRLSMYAGWMLVAVDNEVGVNLGHPLLGPNLVDILVVLKRLRISETEPTVIYNARIVYFFALARPSTEGYVPLTEMELNEIRGRKFQPLANMSAEERIDFLAELQNEGYAMCPVCRGKPPCEACGSTGVSHEQCNKCKGTGSIVDVRDLARCPVCEGNGKIAVRNET